MKASCFRWTRTNICSDAVRAASFHGIINFILTWILITDCGFYRVIYRNVCIYKTKWEWLFFCTKLFYDYRSSSDGCTVHTCNRINPKGPVKIYMSTSMKNRCTSFKYKDKSNHSHSKNCIVWPKCNRRLSLSTSTSHVGNCGVHPPTTIEYK